MKSEINVETSSGISVNSIQLTPNKSSAFMKCTITTVDDVHFTLRRNDQNSNTWNLIRMVATHTDYNPAHRSTFLIQRKVSQRFISKLKTVIMWRSFQNLEFIHGQSMNHSNLDLSQRNTWADCNQIAMMANFVSVSLSNKTESFLLIILK